MPLRGIRRPRECPPEVVGSVPPYTRLEYHDQESIDFDLTIFPNLRDLTWTAHFASGDYSAVAEQIKHATKTLRLQRLALIQADRDQRALICCSTLDFLPATLETLVLSLIPFEALLAFVGSADSPQVKSVTIERVLIAPASIPIDGNQLPGNLRGLLSRAARQ